MSRPRIIVLTPVRNEAWILEKFLATTSRWADQILIADQGSSDGSIEICGDFSETVTVLENRSERYDEAHRQNLLIAAARERFPEPRILLALDADEILAANALGSEDWSRMLEAAPGTVLCFEKPDLWGGIGNCIRYETPWPLGYADDGAKHVPSSIHSIRIPTPFGASRLALAGVKVIHFAHARAGAQDSKARYYSVQENLLRASPMYRRRAFYFQGRNWAASGRIEPADPAWLSGWEAVGVDFREIRSEKYYWQDIEVLRAFEAYGTRRFWLERIWDFDWETCRQWALNQGAKGVPVTPIVGPPKVVRAFGTAVDSLYDGWKDRASRTGTRIQVGL